MSVRVSIGIGSSEILEFIGRIRLDGLGAFVPVGGADLTVFLLRRCFCE